jgi:hypothetical protein
MGTLDIRIEPLAVDVSVTRDALRVVLADGREVSAPIEWFPRLRNATDIQRKDWRLIGRGIGIHWEEIDEDISVESLLAVNK